MSTKVCRECGEELDSKNDFHGNMIICKMCQKEKQKASNKRR